MTEQNHRPAVPGLSPASAGPGVPGVDGHAGVARWYVLRTKARQEKALARVLEAAGTAYYLPLVRRVCFYAHRKRTTLVPAFSNYLFVHGARDQAYAAVASGRVAQLIDVADQSGLEAELEQVRRAIALDADLVPHRYVEKGRPVLVRAGPFKGVRGVVETDVRDGRLVLQIRSLGRALSLEIEAGLLVPEE